MEKIVNIDLSIRSLVDSIEIGSLKLPELQRPFVWDSEQIRDFWDSVYRNYPVGSLLIWDVLPKNKLRLIDADGNQEIPSRAVIDGQQRLTSLYSIIKGKKVQREDSSLEKIQLCFDPLNECFAIPNAAILENKTYIPDISELWNPNANLVSIMSKYVDSLKKELTLEDSDIDKIHDSLANLCNLPEIYNLPSIVLSAELPVKTVAQIFIRVNRGGQKLSDTDFIMTLLAVNWEEGKENFTRFVRDAIKPSSAKKSSYNNIIKPTSEQLLRATIGVAFKCARLEDIYEVFHRFQESSVIDSAKSSNEVLEKLRSVQDAVLNLENWHGFLQSIYLAGFRNEGMISSEDTVIYCYVLYLIGLLDYHVENTEILHIVGEFYFMATLTGRYQNSPESRFDNDLIQILDMNTGEEFVNKLREICKIGLSKSFWSTTLPELLTTTSKNIPQFKAYQASLVILDANKLYCNESISNSLKENDHGNSNSPEFCRLFSKEYLLEQNISSMWELDQIGNLAVADSHVIGSDISSPYDRFKPFEDKMDKREREKTYFWHALTPNWWKLDYSKFLKKRRELMAKVIRSAWEELKFKDSEIKFVELEAKYHISEAESEEVEFKPSLRTDIFTGLTEDRIQHSNLKTITGFLNASGGKLFIGVSDNGEVLGNEFDNFETADKMSLHLVHLVRDRIGAKFMPYIHPSIEKMGDKQIMVVRCDKCPMVAFLKEGNQQKFYIRSGNATLELKGADFSDYILTRFDAKYNNTFKLPPNITVP